MSDGYRVGQLAKQTGSKYALVVGAAKRGRAIMDGAPPLTEGGAVKPVTIALQEIWAGAIRLVVPQAGIK